MFQTFVLSTSLLLPTMAGDPLDELVAKTNALEGFTAIYRLTTRSGKQRQLTLSYAAPDRAALTVTGDDSSELNRMWVADGHLAVLFQAEGQRDFGRVNVGALMDAAAPVYEQFRVEFPDAPPLDRGRDAGGVQFEWDFRP